MGIPNINKPLFNFDLRPSYAIKHFYVFGSNYIEFCI